MDRNIIIEVAILGLFGYLLFFNSTNVNPTLAFVYTILLVVSFAFIFADSNRQIPLLNRNITWAKSLIIAMLSYGILIVASFFSSTITGIIPLNELLSLLGASAPVFSTSVFFNFINFAILIPFIETFAIFAIAIDYFSTAFNIKIDRLSPKVVLLFVLISIAFLFFHIQAKGIENEAALIMVFIMAIISCILVFIYRESRTAILFHIIANTIGLLTFTGVSALSTIPMMIFPILT
jgi:membrane protease YdiL (CAAX protease family)